WKELGPVAFQDYDVYLRTAISVEQEGWAIVGLGNVPHSRCVIFLGEADPARRIGFGDHLGEPAWQEVPGELRADLRRLLVVPGGPVPPSADTQPLACPLHPAA